MLLPAADAWVTAWWSPTLLGGSSHWQLLLCWASPLHKLQHLMICMVRESKRRRRCIGTAKHADGLSSADAHDNAEVRHAQSA